MFKRDLFAIIEKHAREVRNRRRRMKTEHMIAERMSAVAIDSEDLIVGASEIACVLGISPRTLTRWRGEDRFGAFSLVQPIGLFGPLIASRRRLLDLRAQLEGPRRPAGTPTMQSRNWVSGRDALVSALRRASRPVAIGEVVEATGARYSDVGATALRLTHAGILCRVRVSRRARTGPGSVYAYTVADFAAFARLYARCRPVRTLEITDADGLFGQFQSCIGQTVMNSKRGA